MDLNIVALLTTICGSASLGLVAYRRAPDRASSRLFAIHALLVTIWASATLAMQLTGNLQTLATLLKLVHP